MIESVFSSVSHMSVGAAIVIVLVLVLRLLLKKAPKGYSYALWLLVLARLLCPVFPETSFSPMPREITSMSRVEESMIQIPAQNFSEDTPSETVVSAGETIPVLAWEPYAWEEPVYSLNAVLTIIWAAGVGTMLVWGIVSYIMLKRKLGMAVPLEKHVYLADHIDTPFVIGLLRPKIYLPSDMAENWIPHILLHERHHIRRGDPLVKFLFFLALALHWFNPLVWLAYFLMGRDMEMSCDEAVMRKLGDSVRVEYAEALLCLSTRRRTFAGVPPAFGEGDPKGRIRNVLNYRKPNFWLCAAGFALCIFAAVCVLTNSKEERPDQLEYPGLEWNMSPEDVKRELGITEEMIVEEGEQLPNEEIEAYHYGFKVKDLNCFDVDAKTVVFKFIDYSRTGERLGLVSIDIFYSDGYDGEIVDLRTVKKAIEELYGEASGGYSSYSWDQDSQQMKEEFHEARDGVRCWLPTVTAEEYLNDAQKEKIIAFYDNKLSPQIAANMSTEDFVEYVLQGYPLVTVMYMEDHLSKIINISEMREFGQTNYKVSFKASALVEILQKLD